MMTAEQAPVFPMTRNLLWLAAAWAAVVAVTWTVVLLLDAADQVPAMLISALACGIGAALALVPMGLMGASRREGAVNGAMIGMMIRLVVSLGGGAALGWLTQIGIKPVLTWSILWYLLLLVVEITMISRYLMQDSPTHGGAA